MAGGGEGGRGGGREEQTGGGGGGGGREGEGKVGKEVGIERESGSGGIP